MEALAASRKVWSLESSRASDPRPSGFLVTPQSCPDAGDHSLRWVSLGFVFTETSCSPPALVPGLLQISEFFAWSVCLGGSVEAVTLRAELAGARPSSWPACAGTSFAAADCAPPAVTLALLPVVLALSSAARLGPRLPPCAHSPALHGEACVRIFLLCVFSQGFKDS